MTSQLKFNRFSETILSRLMPFRLTPGNGNNIFYPWATPMAGINRAFSAMISANICRAFSVMIEGVTTNLAIQYFLLAPFNFQPSDFRIQTFKYLLAFDTFHRISPSCLERLRHHRKPCN